MIVRRNLGLGVLGTTAFSIGARPAQADYPDRVITIIVPFAGGARPVSPAAFWRTSSGRCFPQVGGPSWTIAPAPAAHSERTWSGVLGRTATPCWSAQRLRSRSPQLRALQPRATTPPGISRRWHSLASAQWGCSSHAIAVLRQPWSCSTACAPVPDGFRSRVRRRGDLSLGLRVLL
jgi:hypothetical protein